MAPWELLVYRKLLAAKSERHLRKVRCALCVAFSGLSRVFISRNDNNHLLRAALHTNARNKSIVHVKVVVVHMLQQEQGSANGTLVFPDETGKKKFSFSLAKLQTLFPCLFLSS